MKTFLIFSTILAISLCFSVYKADKANLKDINWPFTKCGDGPLTITNLTATDKPAKGKNITFTITGAATAKIDFSEVDIAASLNGLPLNVNYFDYKTTVEKGAKITYTYKAELATSIPSGKYTNTYLFLNTQDDTVACIKVDYTI